MQPFDLFDPNKSKVHLDQGKLGVEKAWKMLSLSPIEQLAEPSEEEAENTVFIIQIPLNQWCLMPPCVVKGAQETGC